ncbi:type IV pilin protein [Arsukibacterium sp.]|uniref:type IV pilin protein n=1 Tax=Arsukibacterium sp. TaxID=1977258 RepID=UPI002FDA0735
MNKQQVQAGVTLIELMMVLVIIGILAALVYPSYQQHVLRSYRAEAVQVMLHAANLQEGLLADEGRYTADISRLGLAADGLSTSGRYRLSASLSAAGSAYDLTLQALGPQRADSDCLLFTLNQAGQRNVSAPESLKCWH